MEYAHDINDAGVHLLDIINDILDLSKAEAGKLALVFEEVHVERAIAKCITILSERAAEGQVNITTDIPKGLPYIVADRLRFIQIILNVLSNAVKFTPPGGNVNITVRPEMRGGAVTDFHITIKDTGIGIAPENLQKVFQSFGQIDSGLNRRYEGTGLGLPLTKKLVELHHGNITLESEPGNGTTVIMHFIANPTFVNELIDTGT
jgi:signal transduction histidine kinase